MTLKAKFDISKKHPCMVNGCKTPADPFQEYCFSHLQLVIRQ